MDQTSHQTYFQMVLLNPCFYKWVTGYSFYYRLVSLHHASIYLCVYYIFSKEHQKDFTFHSIYWRKRWRENRLLAEWSIWRGLLHCKIKSLDTTSWILIPECKFSLLRHILVDVVCLIMFIQSSCICNILHSIKFLSFPLSFFLFLNSPDTFFASVQFSVFAPSNQKRINNEKENCFWNFDVGSISRSCTTNKRSKLRRMLDLKYNNRKWH